jgi:2-polyprenyl-3-methyl-5-hydroxy-6-metoxy-1,4-benzoquinol methylase
MSAILELDTDLAQAELLALLQQHEPWAHRIDFSNGVSTTSLARRSPFSENPLNKLQVAARHIPFPDLTGGQLLDIGCNSGFNAIHAAIAYGMRAHGIDVVRRHIEVARLLADLAGVDATFQLADAETFALPGCDVVLHFGTLYHLANPLLSLRTAHANLKRGGWLALETQTFDHPDDPNLAYFMHGHNHDLTNYWALSTATLTTYLRRLHFDAVTTALQVRIERLGEHMHRTILVARKR